MTECQKCHIENTADSLFCRRCGTRLRLDEAAETTLSLTAVEREDTGSRQAQSGVTVSGPALVIRAGGDREGEIAALVGDAFTIGRSPQSDLLLDDVTVSRHHARIMMDEEGLMAEDLNSLNGTYVNRKRIERHHLFDGDELQIGKFKLELVHPDQKT